MNRAVLGGVVLAALALALAFRLARADLRPMHHDEANQAVKFGELLETGDYRYDRHDHHGPTLYYLTLPAAWLRGQPTLASLDERTLRAVPAVFGAGLLLLFLTLARGLGRPAVAAAALLAAVSPALTYYSRFFIQESLFVVFALGFLIALGRFVERPSAWRAACAGAFAGLAYATKETSVIVLPAAVVAVALATLSARPGRPEGPASAGAAPPRIGLGALAAGAAAALGVAFVFYSSFLRYPGGLLESTRAFGVYLDRGVGSGPHTQPFDYYVRLLAYSSSGGLVWSEGIVDRARVRRARCRRPGPERLLAALRGPLHGHHADRRFPPSATRRRGTCCRSTQGPCSWRGTGRPRCSAPRGRDWHAGSSPGRCWRPSRTSPCRTGGRTSGIRQIPAIPTSTRTPSRTFSACRSASPTSRRFIRIGRACS